MAHAIVVIGIVAATVDTVVERNIVVQLGELMVRVGAGVWVLVIIDETVLVVHVTVLVIDKAHVD